MSVTYGRSSGMPFAQYDPDSHYWKTCVDISLWDLMLSSLTLPTWGCLRDGVLYELPMPELPTIEQGSLFLPTPRTSDKNGPGHHGSGGPDLRTVISMLPTPTVQASKHLTMDDRGPGTLDDHNLWSVIGRLLPTPVVNDMGSGKSPEWWEDWTEKIGGHGKSLEQEALSIGGNTKRRSADGNPSLTDPPPLLPFEETIEID